MKIRKVEYAGTVGRVGDPLPGDLPRIAFSGRSNVGKSSLINTLLRRTRSKLAHVSSTPGKTQAINFYRVNDRFFLVDLPGFGYAKVSKTTRAAWKKLIEGYLSGDDGLLGVVHLVDSRHDPTPLDLEMMDYLAELGLPTLVVLTKVDKLKSGRRHEAAERARAVLGIEADQILLFSAKTGEGREDLLESLGELLGSDEPETPSRDAS